ncbi:MAG TPA: hypothetical protein VLA74_05640 [Nitrososphaeraceae archaeon]|nr:hypothetical protein [Nitrososphaeraceae archaeon]
MSIIDKLILRPVPDAEELYKNSRAKEELPEILKILSLWGKNTTNLWRLHIILGITATIFSILAAIGFSSTGIIPDNLDDTNNSTEIINAAQKEIKQLHDQKVASQIFGFLAAVSISLMTAFNLGAKSNDTRNAWRELNAAVLKFNQNIIGKREVISSYEHAETLIGGLTFTKNGISLPGTSPSGTSPSGTSPSGTSPSGTSPSGTSQ